MASEWSSHRTIRADFLYSLYPVEFSLFYFLYFIFFSLTASATSSFHHHVSLRLQGISHICCAVSIIFFILFQCSFTSRYFHSSYHAFVFLTCLFLLELPYTYSCLDLLMPSFCCIKPRVHYYQFMFCTHSFGMILTLRTLALPPCHTIIVNKLLLAVQLHMSPA